jgi:hypothetical protein
MDFNIETLSEYVRQNPDAVFLIPEWMMGKKYPASNLIEFKFKFFLEEKDTMTGMSILAFTNESLGDDWIDVGRLDCKNVSIKK